MRTRPSRARPLGRNPFERGDSEPARAGLDSAPPPIGHNGAPPEPPARRPYGASCAHCQHWAAPSERDVRDYEAFQRGVTRRRVKEPAGFCHRILHSPRGIPAAGGCVGRSFCFNFEQDTRPKPEQDRRGFVTIYEGGRIIWQGTECDEPAEYRQAELDL
ncbi:hypothetical protein [Sphingobium yanoikuyae]|uniref:hypothetical protein n=1 Tax=Sphingobium yanoikuyae TaxID=13690 RepID=UPI000AB39E1E|nr:hypothetical protein [Sphingobium yanoikuyae]